MLRYAVLLLLLSSLTACSARTFREIPLPPQAGGPETLAFDAYGGGPYVGVSDGRILRYDHQTTHWTVFAVMPNWNPSCVGSRSPTSERQCGRPLGLKFHPITHDLYVADAYYGLVRVNPHGGRGVSVARSVGGIPFKFTNSLDINPVSGMIYFTDSSTQFERWEFARVIDTGDRTGRLMVYNSVDHRVAVLRDHLSFPNGVALSRNNDFLLIYETTTGQIWRFWLMGSPIPHTSDLILTLGGRPDNINRDSNGNFWIAQVRRPNSRGDVGMPVNIDMNGRFLERLDAQSGQLVTGASDVKEHNGHIYVGSVVYPSILISN